MCTRFLILSAILGSLCAGGEMQEEAVRPVECERRQEVTLREATALTLLHNPELASFSLGVRAAEARQLQAGLRPNPELEVEVEDIGGTGELSGFDGAETTVQVSQLIERGGKRQKRQEVAALEREIAGWDYEAKRVEVLTEMRRAYFDAAALEEKKVLWEELVGIAEVTADIVGRRVEAGKDAPLDRRKAEVALAKVRIEYGRIEQELEAARKRLALFWGCEGAGVKVAEPLEQQVQEVAGLEELREGLEKNPAIARWPEEIEQRKAALALEKAKGRVDVSLSAGMKRLNEIDDTAFVFGFSVPLPLSDRNQGGKLEAAYNLSRGYREQEAERVRMINELNGVYAELRNGATEVRELGSAVVPGAREVFEAARRMYEEGKADYLNVLDAQRTYFEAQADYIKTLAGYHKARAEMEGLVGEGTKTTETISE